MYGFMDIRQWFTNTGGIMELERHRSNIVSRALPNNYTVCMQKDLYVIVITFKVK